MLLGRFVAVVSRTPAGKRLLWRAWYQFLAWRCRDPRWTFMNYGYQYPGTPGAGPTLAPGTPRAGPTLAPEDEADRSCIQLYDLVARSVPLEGRELLEVGSGRGGGASYVARYLKPRRLVGVDRSSGAVALCRARHAAAGLSFEVGDAEKLPFEDASFDAVLNVESSHCYGNLGAFFAEVWRVLRPGGSFLYADFRPQAELDDWRASLGRARFDIRSERNLTPGVVAALDADDDRKRDLIASLVARPLLGVFREFAALRGSELYGALRSGELQYRAFLASPAG
jgi:ubiquinone/menaquinone biosynthesis C-methylase UbiE